jgi:anti-anti-sigma factor
MESKTEYGILFLIPGSDMIADTFNEMRTFFLDTLQINPEAEVVLDVENVNVIDSLGVNLIIGLYKELSEYSRTFRIINASEQFMKVANFFKFNSIFNIEPKS